MSLSVIPTPRNTAAYIALSIYLGCALLIGGIWYLTSDYMHLRSETRALNADAARISAQLSLEQDRLDEAPTLAELDILRNRIGWYNAQISSGAHPLIEHLDVLEQTLPDDVRLSALFYDRQGRFLTLSMMSEDEDALRAAYGTLSVRYLETLGTTVDLERQVTLDSSGTRQFQFDARITE